MRTDLWAIVLAAGAGRRLASLTGGVPKQFWSDGGPTLLEDTLARTASLVAPDRTAIVVDRSHAPFVDALPAVRRFQHVLFQPRDRGTAAGVLLPLVHALTIAPDAIVLLTPSDHGVARPDIFADGLGRAIRAVQSRRTEIVLLGAAPHGAQGDYGWIVAGRAPVTTDGLAPVERFVEKPDQALARRLFTAGAVWNTMVLVGRASSLLDLYARHLPRLAAAFTSQAEDQRTPGVEFNTRCPDDRQYETLPVADFSRDLLGVARGLSLYTWPQAMGWSDLGTPDRLLQWRRQFEQRPIAAPWLTGPPSFLIAS